MKSSKDKLQEDTLQFFDLWNYLQDSPTMQDVIPPEEIVLLHELVAGHNFEVALDLLRHRLKPCRKHFPDELQDILRPAKCINVRDTTYLDVMRERGEAPLKPLVCERDTEYSRKIFNTPLNERHHPFIATPLPPTPSELNKILNRNLPSVEEEDLPVLPSHRQIMEEQDREYMESIIADLQKRENTLPGSADGGGQGGGQEGGYANYTLFEPWSSSEKMEVSNHEGQVYSNYTLLEPCEKMEVSKHELPDEPLEGDGILVKVRIPTGEILQRHFLATTSFAILQDWLENETGQRMTLASNFPRVVWGPDEFLFDTPIDRLVLNLIGGASAP